MKNKNNITGYRHILTAFIIVLMAAACSDPSDLGMELLPTTDLISVRSIVDYNISAFTVTENSLRTDEPAKNLIGSMADPVFGKTTIDLACQFNPYYNSTFADDAVPDSIFLYLYYKDIYGDTLTPQRLKIYELENDIYVDNLTLPPNTGIYYQDENLSSYAKNTLLADFEFIPKRTTTIDSIYGTLDTLYQTLKIPIDISLAQKLIKVEPNTTSKADIDVFHEFFKGLYIGVDEVLENGTILTLELLTSSTSYGSNLVMFYRQTNSEENKLDTLKRAYYITNTEARINSFKHDYSGLPINNVIDNLQQSNSQIFIQSTGGLRSKLFIPGIDNWKDSVVIDSNNDTTRFMINKAELVFQVDSVASDPTFYTPQNQLWLTIIDNDGKENFPLDYYFSPTFYDGLLDTTDYTYRFNITQYLQEVVKGRSDNNGFYLSSANKNSEFRRVIMKGGGEEKGMQLRIAYSKIIQ